MAADPKQATNSSEPHTGWTKDRSSTLSLSSYQLGAWPWHTEGWRCTENQQWSKIEGMMQPELSLQEHSLGPDVIHSELGGNPPNNLGAAEAAS